MKCLVCNGWAAGSEAWSLCTFTRDWIFDYLEQLDGLPEKVMDDSDEVVLVGFSMGGSTALRLCIAYPEKVRGLVLVSATACMMERKDEGWRGMSHHRRLALKLGTQLMFRGNPSPLYAERNLDRGLDYLQKTDLRPDLEKLKAQGLNANFPVRIFQSERDGIVRPQNADYLKSVFPQAKVTLVHGNEHVLPVTIPAQIDEAVWSVSSRRGSSSSSGNRP